MEMIYLLEKPHRDPFALSRFSQFRLLSINKGEIVQNLNENQEFQLCFVLKGTLCFYKNQTDAIPQLVTKNELFFISRFHKCNIRAVEDVQIIVHACNIVAPYFHSRILEYLGDVTIDKLKPIEVLPIYPQLTSYLDSLVEYMKLNAEIPDLHLAKEYELFSLFKICYGKTQIASIFRDALSKDLQFFVSVMKHYKACRTAKELAVACGYHINLFNQMFKGSFQGYTPYQWLQRQTSSEIEYKLRETNQPIKEIMLEYHFKTFSHFTTYCKRNIGCTPNEVRRKETSLQGQPSLISYVSAADEQPNNL